MLMLMLEPMLELMLELIGLPDAGVESSRAAAFAALKHGSFSSSPLMLYGWPTAIPLSLYCTSYSTYLSQWTVNQSVVLRLRHPLSDVTASPR